MPEATQAWLDSLSLPTFFVNRIAYFMPVGPCVTLYLTCVPDRPQQILTPEVKLIIPQDAAAMEAARVLEFLSGEMAPLGFPPARMAS